MSSAAVDPQDAYSGHHDNNTASQQPQKKRKSTNHNEDVRHRLEKTPDGGYKIQTYYPTLEEMNDFSAYLKHIHETGGNLPGLAKIIPPNNYSPRKAGYDDEKLYRMEITSPIKQQITGESGLYQQMNFTEKKKMTVRDFKILAEQAHATPAHTTPEELERSFWRSLLTTPSLYGADVPGSLYDKDEDKFNLTKLNTILDDIRSEYGVTIEGVNTTYLYFGMWKSSFCWHTEDMDLYSINYLHTGAPKAWYCVPPEHGKRFEDVASNFFPHHFRECRAFLRHKTTLISPQVLRKFSIPFSRCTQQAGEFMITFPYSYHSGFNHGFNIAEATNFALEYWIDYGKWATRCECSEESVKISMQAFVKRYQADRYENWILGRDVCRDPRDPKDRLAPAPRPNEYDLYLRGKHERTEEDMMEQQRVALHEKTCSNLKSKTKSNQLKMSAELYKLSLLKNNGANPELDGKMMLAGIDTPVSSQDKGAAERGASKNDQKASHNRKAKSKRDEKRSQKKEEKARERIALSQGLLHFLPSSFTQEKKFNRCIAALDPHCSICQISRPHPQDHDEIWGPKAELEQSQAIVQTQSNSNSQDSGPLSLVAAHTSPACASEHEFKIPKSSQIRLPNCTISALKKIRPPRLTDHAVVDGEQVKKECTDFLDTDLDEPSELLQCTVCMLAVHARCYGIRTVPESKSDWVCDRCIEPNRSIIGCSLCPCRGGALKQTIDGQWVHITCALALDLIRYSDLIKSVKKIELSSVNQERKEEKNSCIYCIKTNFSKSIAGRCMPCSGGKARVDLQSECNNTFHPTCAHRNGGIFDCFEDDRELYTEHSLKAMCYDCSNAAGIHSMKSIDATNEVDAEDEIYEPLKIGSRVIAESKKGLFLDCFVVSVTSPPRYRIYFPEENMTEMGISERAILNRDKTGKTEFNLGDEVQVRIYKTDAYRIGKFVSKDIDETECLVRYLSGKTERISRKNIYLNIDQMSAEQTQRYLENVDRSIENDSPKSFAES